MDANRKESIRRKVMERLAPNSQYRLSSTSSGVSKDKVLTEISLLPISQPKPTGEYTRVPRQTLLSCFMQLPPELQLRILSYLDYGEIQQLRRANRLFRSRINQAVVQNLFPDLNEAMLCTCYVCLAKKAPYQLIRGSYTHPRYPLTSRCFDCMARQSGFMVGQRYALVNWELVWVCRWCGYPAMPVEGYDGLPQFHPTCYNKYKGVLATHLAIGVVQWIIVIVSSALCWQNFKRVRLVMSTVAASFSLSFVAWFLGLLRGSRMRTYHFSLLLELAILALWVPPMYVLIVQKFLGHYKIFIPMSKESRKIMLAFIALNMLCRVLNCLGHLILLCEWKIWRRSKPGTSLVQRAVANVMLMLVVWAHPQSIEQEYPPSWWINIRFC